MTLSTKRINTFSVATTQRSPHALIRLGIIPLAVAFCFDITHSFSRRFVPCMPATMAITTRSQIQGRGQPRTLQQRPPLHLSKLPIQPLYSSIENIESGGEKQAPTATPSPRKKRRAKQPHADESKGINAVTPSPKKKIRVTSSDEERKDGILSAEAVAAINPSQPFLDLEVHPSELRPSATLTTGQCFHWKAIDVVDESKAGGSNGETSSSDNRKKSAVAIKKESAWGIHDATEWVGTLRTNEGESIVLVIRETPTTTLYRPLTSVPEGLDLSQFLYSYFQLDHSLSDLYKIWSKADGRLSTIAKCIPGVRIVDQDPWECLISFICSSNNNIPRITKMLSSIRRHYGKPLVTIGGDTFYSFPSLDEFSLQATDEDLRNKCGLGYRSKYILETMKVLKSLGGETYLKNLRLEDDPTIVQEKLIQ